MFKYFDIIAPKIRIGSQIFQGFRKVSEICLFVFIALFHGSSNFLCCKLNELICKYSQTLVFKLSQNILSAI